MERDIANLKLFQACTAALRTRSLWVDFLDVVRPSLLVGCESCIQCHAINNKMETALNLHVYQSEQVTNEMIQFQTIMIVREKALEHGNISKERRLIPEL